MFVVAGAYWHVCENPYKVLESLAFQFLLRLVVTAIYVFYMKYSIRP